MGKDIQRCITYFKDKGPTYAVRHISDVVGHPGSVYIRSEKKPHQLPEIQVYQFADDYVNYPNFIRYIS
jgi:hypothetical protein